MKKQSAMVTAADKYMRAATKRFGGNRHKPSDETFVNGFSWGAHAGYLAGFRAAQRKKRS